MRRRITFGTIGLITISAIVIVGCSKDDELEMYKELDVTSNTPITRSTSMDGFEINSGGYDTSYKNVPKNENECMLNAMIQIAVDNRIPIKYETCDSKGNPKIVNKTIGQNYPASSAYEYVKSIAKCYQQSTYDSNGNETTGYYNGGAMVPSVAAQVGKRTGILCGETITFSSYEALYDHISSARWKNEHGKGTYIINNNNDRHASICTGVKDGNIKIKSAEFGSGRFSEENNGNDSFVLIY